MNCFLRRKNKIRSTEVKSQDLHTAKWILQTKYGENLEETLNNQTADKYCVPSREIAVPNEIVFDRLRRRRNAAEEDDLRKDIFILREFFRIKNQKEYMLG